MQTVPSTTSGSVPSVTLATTLMSTAVRPVTQDDSDLGAFSDHPAPSLHMHFGKIASAKLAHADSAIDGEDRDRDRLDESTIDGASPDATDNDDDTAPEGEDQR